MTAQALPVLQEYSPQAHGARCDLCPLRGSTVVPPKPSPLPTKFVFVGEAPGRKEELCLVPETLVLMGDLTWRTLDEIRVGDKLLTVNEHGEAGNGASGREGRRWTVATVLGRHEREAETIRVEMASGRDLIGTPDHHVMTAYRFKSWHKRRWLPMSTLQAREAHDLGRKKVRHNKRNSCITSIGAPWLAATTWEAGWLAGFLDGEGHVHGSKKDVGGRSGTVGFAQNIGPVADYAEQCIRALGFELRRHEDQRSYTGKIVRRAHVAGGFQEAVRFLGTVRPMRLITDFVRVVDRKTVRNLAADPVLRKTPAGVRRVIDITTTAGTFIANGFVVHNCGVPFVGQTGVFLKGLCREVDLDILSAHLTNSALCRSNIDRENDEASVCCAPRLLRELAEFDPKIPIVTLGKSSTLSVLGVRSIMHSRGFVWTARELDPGPAWSKARKAKTRGAPKWKELWLKAQITEGRSKLAGRTVLPTVHPAFVLRSDTWLPVLKIDLDRIARWVRGELTYKKLLDNGPYVVASKRDDIRRELKKLGPDIDVDVETGASTEGGKDGADPLRNRLLCVGISDGDHTVVIWPWRKTFAPLLNAALKRARTVGMHNGYNFDQIVLDRYDVPFEPIDDKLEDTLIAHHTFASHMPQRLSHVASLFCDVGPWKVTFKQGTGGATEKGLPPEKLSGEDLCKYNAADARIQARTRRAMRADLEDELAVYAVDKENARLCRAMIIAGIGVDLERRTWLHEEILKKQIGLLDKMRVLLKRPNFHPMQLAEVRRALFTTLRAPMSASDPTSSGLPSTSQTTLERLKSSPTRAGRFADLLLQWRGGAKIDGTYIYVKTQPIDKPSKKHPTVARTHVNWRSYGAGSGRYSCRLQSAPRAEYMKDKSIVLETRVREFYVARPGCKLVYFDLSQAELRFAAYLSGDQNFVAACESGDVHTATAMRLFPAEAELIGRDPKGAGKPFRDVEKNSIFGFIYYAEPATVFAFVRSKGLPIEMRDVVYIHDMLHQEMAGYFRYVELNKRIVDKVGHMRCALSGRISWLGWHAGYPDVANRPIQGGIASLMNVRLPAIARQLPKGVKRHTLPSFSRRALKGAEVVAQVHDAAIMEVPDRYVEQVSELVKKTWEEPVIIPANGYGTSLRVEEGARQFVMPIDLKVGQRWSDFG